jgi:Zn-dependent protease
VHEFSHAFAAWSLGDSTARRAGRLTLNPLRHLDPFGSLMLLLTLFSGAPGIGWGKPVPVDPRALRFGRAGMAIVAAAGPLSNLATALAVALAFRFVGTAAVDVPPLALDFLARLITLSIGLCVFNLLPIAPLDGFGVAVGVLPRSVAEPIARLGQYGPGILLILIFSGTVIGVNLLSLILRPPTLKLLELVRTVARAG